MTTPELWGPRLWRLLHTLADLSDRRDIYPLWNSFLRATTANIPCQKCQTHMNQYWSQHRFLPRGWDRMTSIEIRDDIRAKLHAFHNNVNVRLGKPEIPLSHLASVDRSALYEQIRTDFEFLKETWPSVHRDWKQATTLLMQLVHAGPS